MGATYIFIYRYIHAHMMNNWGSIKKIELHKKSRNLCGFFNNLKS